jgi:hypothetical protein
MGKRLVKLKIDNMNLQEQINRIHEMMFEQKNDANNTKKILFKLIDKKVEGADLYEHEGSLWLIFTDDKEWVIKLNKEGYLWYNEDFFNSVFKYLSLDVVENQRYITEWVEDTIQNGVKYTSQRVSWWFVKVEDTIQNGVKYTAINEWVYRKYVEDTIQNGVKYTRMGIGNVKDMLKTPFKMGKRLVKLKIDNMNLQENINRIHEMMFEQKNDSNNTKKILFKLIDKKVEGADLYEHEGSLWLIFTDDKEWVIKLNKEGSLLYNYDFFNSVFKYLSLDVVENQRYITEWVEDTIQNGVKYTKAVFFGRITSVEDTIQNGKKIGKIKNR